METATKAPEGVRPADKVLQALATLVGLLDSTIREVKSLDSEFQSRLVQAVRETEASLQIQAAQHVERARQEVQGDLTTKFQTDLQAALDGLKAEFETERGRFNAERSALISEAEKVKADFSAELENAREEGQKAVQHTETALQAQAAESVQRARQEVQEELTGKFQTDLQGALDGLKAEFETERGRFNAERSAQIAEVGKLKADFAAEIEKTREEGQKTLQHTEASLQAQAVENIQRARQEVQEELTGKFKKELQVALDGLNAEFETERGRFNAERSALIADVEKLKADFAAEIEKTREEGQKALQHTETSLQAQSAESVQRARQEVQEELTGKFKKELQVALDGLKAEFETERGRLNAERSALIAEAKQAKTDSAAALEKARQDAKNAVQHTETSLQAQSAESVQRARQEVQEELTGKFKKELQVALDGLKAEFETERGRLNAERSALIAEAKQAKTDSAAALEKARQDAKNAVQHTETSLQAQSAESVQRARQEVQEELTGKFKKDLQVALDGAKAELETERGRFNTERSALIAEAKQVKADSAAAIEKARQDAKNAVQQTETSLQSQSAENIERARREVQDDLNNKHRKDLQAAQESLKSGFEAERERLNKELLHTVEIVSKLEAERSGLIAEVQQVKADSAVEIEKARQDAKAAAAKQPVTASAAASAPASAPPASLQQEIARAEAKLEEALKIIDNPATELSTVIRKNVEKSELEAYLRGIRLVLDSKK